MIDPDETLKSDEQQVPRSGGPFSVEPVDPLVYRQSSDSPEMRAAAAYIPVANRRLRIRDPKPVKAEQREHDQWTPGGPQQPGTPAPETPSAAPTRLGMRILTALLILVPLALIVAAVAFGASLADF